MSNIEKALHNSFHQWDGLLYKYLPKEYEAMGEVWKQDIRDVIALVKKSWDESGKNPEAAGRAFAEYANIDYDCMHSKNLRKGCELAVKTIIERL